MNHPIDDGDQDVGGHGAPNLCLHCVFFLRNFLIHKRSGYLAVADVDEGWNEPTQLDRLSKGYKSELLCVVHPAHTRMAAVALHAAPKACLWSELHDLRKQRLAHRHGTAPRASILGKYIKIGNQVSNLHQKIGRKAAPVRAFASFTIDLTVHY